MVVGVIVGGTGVNIEVGIAVLGGATLTAGAQEAVIKATNKTVMIFLIFIDYLVMQGIAQPALRLSFHCLMAYGLPSINTNAHRCG